MDDDDARPFRAIRLGKAARWASGAFGTVASASGATAVFVTDNQAGSTALLLVGGVGLLVALTGRVPDRMGREGVVYAQETFDGQAAKETLLDIASTNAPPAVQREDLLESYLTNLEALRSDREGPPGGIGVLEIEARTSLYEQRVIGLLQDAVRTEPFACPSQAGRTVMESPAQIGDLIWDAAVYVSDDPDRYAHGIAVEVDGWHNLLAVRARIDRWARAKPTRALLVVVRTGKLARALAESVPGCIVVAVTDREMETPNLQTAKALLATGLADAWRHAYPES